MPTCSEKRISGAIVGRVIPENVTVYSMRKGWYVMDQNGEHLELWNEAEFAVKVW